MPPLCARCVQEDLEYVLHFPKGEKYVAVLRDAEDPAAQVGAGRGALGCRRRQQRGDWSHACLRFVQPVFVL